MQQAIQHNRPQHTINIQQLLLEHKKQNALPYACKALEKALFGSAEEWQSIRDELIYMQRSSTCQPFQ